MLAEPRGFLPLVGFVRWESAHRCASPPLAPSSTRRFGVHSRRHCCRLRRRGSHPRRTFRPRGFAPPRRLPPPERSRACCIPLPILGFAAFPTRSPRFRADRRLPRDALRTPRRMIPSGSRTASPRPLPPCRFHDFEALLHLRVRYACHGLLRDLRPVLPGLRSPFKVLPDDSEARCDRPWKAPHRRVRRTSPVRARSRVRGIGRPRREARTTSARSGRDPSRGSLRRRAEARRVASPGVCPEPKSRHHCR